MKIFKAEIPLVLVALNRSFYKILTDESAFVY
jgi:hypothetical protein